MAATQISRTLLTSLRENILSAAAYGRYKIGGTWYTSPISFSSIRANGSVELAFYITRQDNNGTPATHFQLMNSRNEVLAEREETVQFMNGLDLMVYRFKFSVTVAS